jgi:hypothetical protein
MTFQISCTVVQELVLGTVEKLTELPFSPLLLIF